ncbi:DUF3011 domain-containing protein [Parvularcula sp. LCG005]|uniref:DUF3011 domain-containing protein n=1 Tax=Parvularcula sp. LCG005 TaxID=3078805 RepID=UPI0029434361|nr:DUF3011 domain-containing protein [Parvularcula sp. LCG005]WOI53155.1 DUF3011 domain-containing protein [Parvularcula sp. LCG005]
MKPLIIIAGLSALLMGGTAIAAPPRSVEGQQEKAREREADKGDRAERPQNPRAVPQDSRRGDDRRSDDRGDRRDDRGRDNNDRDRDDRGRNDNDRRDDRGRNDDRRDRDRYDRNDNRRDRDQRYDSRRDQRDWDRRDQRDWDRRGNNNRGPRVVRQRDRQITCYSRGAGRQVCTISGRYERIRYLGPVSGYRCREGIDWGITSRGVWVTNGCRANFGYVEYYDDYGYDDYGRDEFVSLSCESTDYRYRSCAVPRGAYDVRLQRVRSDSNCRRGRDWGITRGGVWVDNGCRAVFAYRYDSYGYDRPYATSGSVVRGQPGY